MAALPQPVAQVTNPAVQVDPRQVYQQQLDTANSKQFQDWRASTLQNAYDVVNPIRNGRAPDGMSADQWNAYGNKLNEMTEGIASISPYARTADTYDQWLSKYQADKTYNPYDINKLNSQYLPQIEAAKQGITEFNKLTQPVAGAIQTGVDTIAKQGQQYNQDYQTNIKTLDDWLTNTQKAGNPAINEGYTKSIGALDQWKQGYEKYNPAQFDAKFDQGKSKLDDWLKTNQAKYGNDARLTTAYDAQIKKLQDQVNAAKGQYQPVYDKITGAYNAQKDKLTSAKDSAYSNWQKQLQSTYEQQKTAANTNKDKFYSSLNEQYNKNYYDQVGKMNTNIAAFLKRLGVK